MKKLFSTLITAIILLGITTTVSAISLSEKEDIYRVDEFLGYSLDKEYVINWLLESDNFIYHLHESAPSEYVNRFVLEPALTVLNITGEALSGNVSVAFETKKDYYSALKDVLLSFSTDESILNTDELKIKVRMEYLNTFKNDLAKYALSTPDTADLAAYIDLLQVRKQLQSISDLKNDLASVATGEAQQRLWRLMDDYNASKDFADNMSKVSDVVKYASKGVEVARFSYDLLMELETYNTINSQMTGVLKEIYENSTNPDVKKVAGELYAKTMNSKEENLSAAVDEIYKKIGEAGGETAIMIGMDIAVQKLNVSSVVAYAQLGITMGNLFSDLAFGTSDIREQLTYIEATNAISEVLSKRLQSKIDAYSLNYSSRDGMYEERALAAKDIILYSKLLLQTRMKGEKVYYKFKSTVFESGMSNIVVGTIDELFSFLGVNLKTPYDKIDLWYESVCADFITAESILYSYIDTALYQDMYEYKLEKEDFHIVGGRLISYSGDDASVVVPYEVDVIGTEAFNAEILMTQLTIRGTTMENRSVSNCGELYELYIPKSVTTIESEAIYNCPNVTIYGYTGTAAETYAKTNGIPFVSIGTTEYDGGMYVNAYTLSEGTLDLAGKTMYVGGDFLHTGGTLKINGGKLVIFGDYNIANESGASSSGVLQMTNESDYVTVHGNFVMYSSNEHTGELTAGVLEVKGDFTQKSASNSNSNYNFNAGGSHKVIFSGSGEQGIKFETPSSSGFADVEFKNTKINIQSHLRGWTLQRDTVIDNDVNYSVCYSTQMNLNGHKLEITGTYIQDTGTMNINGGKLVIGGGYNITDEDGTSSNSVLQMKNESDYVTVHGNFVMHSSNEHTGKLTAGVLEVKGDFTQKSASNSNSNYNFNAGGSHKVIFSGSGEQVIKFENPSYSGFNILINKNPNGVIFATAYRCNELQIIHPFYFETAKYNSNTNKVSVAIKMNEELQAMNGKVLISLYDDSNRLVDCCIEETDGISALVFNGLSNYSGAYVVKAFYWTDMRALVPLHDAIQRKVVK